MKFDEKVEFVQRVLNISRGIVMTSLMDMQGKQNHIDDLEKLENMIIPICDCCCEIKEGVDDTGYCDYCKTNGNYCKDCGELFVDDCINEYCFDCRLDHE